MIPAMIKQFVMIYDNTIAVLITAIRSLSWSVAPDFSPNALLHRRQSLALVDCGVCTMFKNLGTLDPHIGIDRITHITTGQ